MTGPVPGNQQVRVSGWVVRERIAAGAYRYWTPLGCLWVRREGEWTVGMGSEVLGTGPTLDALDGVVAESVAAIVPQMAYEEGIALPPVVTSGKA